MPTALALPGSLFREARVVRDVGSADPAPSELFGGSVGSAAGAPGEAGLEGDQEVATRRSFPNGAGTPSWQSSRNDHAACALMAKRRDARTIREPSDFWRPFASPRYPGDPE